MRKLVFIFAAFFVFCAFAVESFAINPDSYNTKRGIRKVLNGGGKMKARTFVDKKTGLSTNVPTVSALIKSSQGTWGAKPRTPGVYDFKVVSGTGQVYATGKYTLNKIADLGSFKMASTDDGAFKVAKFSLSDTGKNRMNSGENIAIDINKNINKYGYNAFITTRKVTNPTTGQEFKAKVLKIEKMSTQ